MHDEIMHCIIIIIIIITIILQLNKHQSHITAQQFGIIDNATIQLYH